MTELRFTEKTLPGFALGGTSRFPLLRKQKSAPFAIRTDEDDGLFIHFGMSDDTLPHCMQDDYDLSGKKTLTFKSAVLENEHLRAEFVLDLGGRLWSLFDKDSKRDLFTNNPEFRPHNLAVRNAWFAGGVEWNFGIVGHDINTCSPRFAAELNDPELGPVLRIYDYSPDRRATFQLDFYLPPDSRFLFSRARILNPNSHTVPMYWWTNMAVNMTRGCRVVVPARDTYSHCYEAGVSGITKIPLPFGPGFDCTYPENFPSAHDHFYHIPDDHRKYECLFNRDGSGVAHLSTRRLQGRKLFVWGQTQGGHHWQRQLLGEGDTEYLEIQGGLAHTQQECLPMPPKTAWEWVEAFGAIQAQPGQVFADWDTAVNSVTAQLNEMLPEANLDGFLVKTRPLALSAGILQHRGSGAAALEEMRRGERLVPNLDFGEITENEADWAKLLSEKSMGDTPPRTYAVDADWAELLKKATPTWKTQLHLAIHYFHISDAERALKCAETALKMRSNAWTLYTYGMVQALLCDRKDIAADVLVEAARQDEADGFLIKEILNNLIEWGFFECIVNLFPQLKPSERRRPMARFLYASALTGLERFEEAQEVLLENGGLDIPDVREGARNISALYIKIRENLLKKAGKDPATAADDIPYVLDYRMT